jgi:WD40 repeat protein
MRLGSRFTSLSDSVFRLLFKFLFRYDIFISYARSDGKEYAAKLRDQLRQLDFSCFLDYDELPPGNALNKTLKWAIKKSAALVVVGTERAVKSRYVEMEVEEFAKTGRAIIPIDFEGTLEETPWPVIKERDIVWIDEVRVALNKGIPTPIVADSVDRLFKYTRRNSRVRMQVLSTIILFVIIVIASIFLIRQQVNAATRASAEATRASAEAKVATARAVAEKKTADAATRIAELEKANAKTASDKAATAEKAALDSANNAKEQERIASVNAERAKAEQARAEERTRYVVAQQVGVQADIAREKGEDLEQGVLLSIESLKRSLTPEGYIAWERGMDQLPHPAEMQFASAGNDVSTIAYSRDGKLFAQGNTDGAVTLFKTDQPATYLELPARLTNKITTINFAPDGTWVAASDRRQIKVWDTKTFKLIRDRQLNADRCCAESIAFSPDGRYVALTGPSWGTLVRVIDLINSQVVVDTKLPLVNYAMSVAFSPDGKWLAVSCHSKAEGPSAVGKIMLWDVSTFRKRIDGMPPAVASVIDKELIGRVVFSPQGNYLATKTANGVRMWSVSTEKDSINFGELEQAQKIRGEGENERSTLEFTADEKYVVTVVANRTALWDVTTGLETGRINYKEAIAGVALSSDSRLLAIAAGDVRSWKIEFGSEVQRIAVHDKSSEEKLNALAVSPGGEWLATGSSDGVRVFRASDWSPLVTLPQAGKVLGLTFDAAGRWLISASDNKVTAFDTKRWEGKTVDQAGGHPSLSPDGHWLVVAAESVLKLFEYGTWRAVHTMTHSDPVQNVSFSPDGRWLAVRSSGRYRSPSRHAFYVRERTYVWDLKTGLPAACATDQDTYSKAENDPLDPNRREAVCPDSKGVGQQALLAQVPQWKESQEFNLISVTKDGRWSVTREKDLTLNLKDGITSRQVARLMSGESRNASTFTPDGRWLVVAGENSLAIRPLQPVDMIQAACNRLRRRDLSADEWKQYFSGEKLERTCPLKIQ